MEERLAKMGHDVCHMSPNFAFKLTGHLCGQRGKSENKFYAAMRDKEAIETERKNLSRNLEKQAKVLEKLQESEKSLTLQVVGATVPPTFTSY
jgi:E3 ubiquitin-protein ligase BRE1